MDLENLDRGFYTVTKLSRNKYLDNDGTLVCKNAVLGKAGQQSYIGYELGLTDDYSNEIIVVDRPPEQVFDEQSLSSLKGKSLTLNHPEEEVTIDNIKDLAKGFIMDVWQEGDKMVGDVRITDQEVIDLITSGEMVELSLGYETKLKRVEDNRLKQTDIVYNHLALVKRGRAEVARIVDNQTTRVMDKQFDLQEGGTEVPNQTEDKAGLFSKFLSMFGMKEKEVSGEKVYVIDEKTNEVVEDPTPVEDDKPEATEEPKPTEDEKTEETEGQEETETVTDEQPVETETEDEKPDENPPEDPDEDTTTVSDNDTPEGENEEMTKEEKLMAQLEKAEAIKDEDFKKELRETLLAQYKASNETTEVNDNSALDDFDNVTLEDGSKVEPYNANEDIQKLYDDLNPHNYDSYQEYMKVRKKMDKETKEEKFQDLVSEAVGGLK